MPRPRKTNDPIKQVGLWLRIARESAELSQAAAARSVNVEANRWNQWENGRRTPDAYVLAKFVSMQGLTLDLIYRGNLVGLSVEKRAKVLELLQKHQIEAA